MTLTAVMETPVMEPPVKQETSVDLVVVDAPKSQSELIIERQSQLLARDRLLLNKIFDYQEDMAMGQKTKKEYETFLRSHCLNPTYINDSINRAYDVSVNYENAFESLKETNGLKSKITNLMAPLVNYFQEILLIYKARVRRFNQEF